MSVIRELAGGDNPGCPVVSEKAAVMGWHPLHVISTTDFWEARPSNLSVNVLGQGYRVPRTGEAVRAFFSRGPFGRALGLNSSMGDDQRPTLQYMNGGIPVLRFDTNDVLTVTDSRRYFHNGPFTTLIVVASRASSTSFQGAITTANIASANASAYSYFTLQDTSESPPANRWAPQGASNEAKEAVALDAKLHAFVLAHDGRQEMLFRDGKLVGKGNDTPNSGHDTFSLGGLVRHTALGGSNHCPMDLACVVLMDKWVGYGTVARLFGFSQSVYCTP